ncbi:MAG: hypothetical protein LBH25_09605 [Fibromonadaceae bacterium]|jgi:hypothetical protein|nr:hypothetical protein [Fibromonadaceae bacterium]
METATPSATDTQAAQAPAMPGQAPPQEPSQEAIYADLQAAQKEDRPYSPQKTKDQSAEYQAKLNERLGSKPATVKFAPPNPQMAESQSRQDRMIGKLEEFYKLIENAQENTYERLRLQNQIDMLEGQIAENAENAKNAIKKEIAEALSGDKEFKDRHDYYAPYFSELNDGNEFIDAVLKDDQRVGILSGLYEWFDQPGNLQRFMSAPKEARLLALSNFTASVKYKDRIPSPAAQQAVQDRLPLAQQAANAQAQPFGVAPPKFAPGSGAEGGGVDWNSQESVYAYLKRKDRQ